MGPFELGVWSRYIRACIIQFPLVSERPNASLAVYECQSNRSANASNAGHLHHTLYISPRWAKLHRIHSTSYTNTWKLTANSSWCDDKCSTSTQNQPTSTRFVSSKRPVKIDNGVKVIMWTRCLGGQRLPTASWLHHIPKMGEIAPHRIVKWCITQLAKLSFNHISIGRTHSWRFSMFFK